MQPKRFDQLVSTFAQPRRRREILAVAGLLAASVLRIGGVEAATCRAAGSKCRKASQCCSRACKRKRCRCAVGTQACNGACVDLQRDLANCGACGRSCPGAINCMGGECVCAADRQLCGNACVVLAADTRHCGTCGHACDQGDDCRQGRCCHPGFHRLEQPEEPLCCPVDDICAGDICCFPGDDCVNATCCAPEGYSVCAGGLGDCCPSNGDFQCCGKTCCQGPAQCCDETCCREGSQCCPDDGSRCCTVADACPNGTCDCYADRFLNGGRCWARFGSGGGGFRRARGVL